MKKYKATYLTGLLFNLNEFYLIMIPSAILLVIMLKLNDQTVEIFKVAVGVLVSCCLINIFCILLMLIISLIVNAITDNYVLLGDNEIIYQDKKIFIRDIKYVTLYLPERPSRTHYECQQLSLWADDKNHIVIKRPSLALIAELKIKCSGAKFEIDELGSRIKTDIILAVCIAVFLAIIIFFDDKG